MAELSSFFTLPADIERKGSNSYLQNGSVIKLEDCVSSQWFSPMKIYQMLVWPEFHVGLHDTERGWVEYSGKFSLE